MGLQCSACHIWQSAQSFELAKQYAGRFAARDVLDNFEILLCATISKYHYNLWDYCYKYHPLVIQNYFGSEDGFHTGCRFFRTTLTRSITLDKPLGFKSFTRKQNLFPQIERSRYTPYSMVLQIIRADILWVVSYFSEPRRGEEKCEQRVKCPRVLSVTDHRIRDLLFHYTVSLSFFTILFNE